MQLIEVSGHRYAANSYAVFPRYGTYCFNAQYITELYPDHQGEGTLLILECGDTIATAEPYRSLQMRLLLNHTWREYDPTDK